MNNFVSLPIEELNINTKVINQQKLDLDINDIFNNDIILISSGTATGKTRNIGNLSNQMKEKYNCNILSIVNLISLSKEQRLVFQEEAKLKLCDYQKEISLFGKCDGVICINSLYKLNDIKDFDMTNTILYIDEVNDLIRTITHNNRLDKVLNMVYTTLIKLIKSCKKIILSDATIDKNTLNLLSSRKTNNKTLLIKNTNKKFSGIDAIRQNDENEFINTLRSYIENKKYFLFGCDCNKRITTIYQNLLNEFENQKDDFILISGDTDYRPENASIEFKNKYVFYTPSITTGVSFVLKDVKQTQFIYISDNPLITPISIYQMSSRTRNMDKLYYYARDIKPQSMKFNSLNDAEEKYKKIININEKLFNLSKSVSEDDEIKIIENTYFKLFCYNEFQDTIFKTGFLKHFENILTDNGFNIVAIGAYNKLNKENNKQFREVFDMIKEAEYETFLKKKFIEYQSEADLQDYLDNYKSSNLDKRIDLLGLTTRSQAEQYKLFITDEYALTNYFNLLNLFKTDIYISNKLTEKNEETFKIKSITTIFSKIKLLIEFEKHYKIKRFELTTNMTVTPEISDDFKELYKNIFPKRSEKSFDNNYELLKIYINMIKNICGDIPIITSKKCKKNNKSYYEYKLNNELLIELLSLTKITNPILKNYDLQLVETHTNLKPEKISTDDIKDEDDVINGYLFNKLNYKSRTNKDSIEYINSQKQKNKKQTIEKEVNIFNNDLSDTINNVKKIKNYFKNKNN